MKAQRCIAMLLALLLLAALTGCGGASKGTEAIYAAGDQAVAETWAAAEEPAAMDNGLSMESTTQGQSAPQGRKWIITVDMSAETEDLDAMMESLQGQISAMGGYVENQQMQNGSRYDTYRYRSVRLTIRIPADRVDEFTREVEGFTNVIRSSRNMQDITLQYVATESRITALQTEEARLLELMAQAENMSDLLEIEQRLTDVRYELELSTSQLRLYDNQVDYATVYLWVEEVKEYTPVAEETVWQRISGGFSRSLKGVGKGAVNVMVWVITNSPYILVYGLMIAGGVVLLRRIKWKKKVKSVPRKPEEEDSGS